MGTFPEYMRSSRTRQLKPMQPAVVRIRDLAIILAKTGPFKTPELLDFLHAGGEEHSRGAVAKALTVIIIHGQLRRIGKAVYAMPLEAPAPPTIAPAPVADTFIREIKPEECMAGRWRTRRVPLQHPMWSEDAQ